MFFCIRTSTRNIILPLKSKNVFFVCFEIVVAMKRMKKKMNKCKGCKKKLSKFAKYLGSLLPMLFIIFYSFTTLIIIQYMKGNCWKCI